MRKVLLIGLVSAALPAYASAQVASASAIDAVRKDARMHVGPLYLTPTVHLKELGVDGNVFNESVQPKSDFTFTMGPKADLWVPFARRALLTTTVANDLVWYAKYDSERSVNPQFTSRAEIYLHRITLFGQNAYLNTRERPNYEIDLRSRHTENDATAGIDVRVTPKLSFEAAAVRGITRYESDAYFDGASLRKTLNRDTTGIRIVGRHHLTPLTTLAVRVEDLQDRFPFQPARDSDSVRVMPGVEFKSRALINGSAFVGYRRFTPLTPAELPEFSGLVSHLGLSYTLLGSTTLGVTYRRDLTYSYEALQPFFVNDNVGASIRRALGSRFDVLLSGDRFKYAYRNLIVPSALPTALMPQRIDTTYSYSGSLGYRVGRTGRIGFGVSYTDRTSVGDSVYTTKGLRAGTILSYGF